MTGTTHTRAAAGELRALPATRPSRVVVEPVRPVVDGDRFPAKATVDEPGWWRPTCSPTATTRWRPPSATGPVIGTVVTMVVGMAVRPAATGAAGGAGPRCL